MIYEDNLDGRPREGTSTTSLLENYKVVDRQIAMIETAFSKVMEVGILGRH